MDNKKTNSPILNKHIGLIHCEGRLTLLQRKICNILLFNALSDINSKEIFEIGLKHLCSLIGYKSNDVALIKKSLLSLISIVIEWNLLDQKKIQHSISDEILNRKIDISWHASSLLAGVSIENGKISYSYSPQIKKVISSFDVYGRINLFVQAKFKSNYSLALYENCVRFKNIKQTCLFDLAVFRSLMGIDINKYPSFKELSRNIITPAVKEINEKSDIELEVEFKKTGRKVIGLKFFIKDNENYLPKLKRKEKKFTNAALKVKDTLISTFKIKETDAEYIVEKFEPEYIKTKLDEIYKSKSFKNSKIYNLNAYISSILEANYQTKVEKEENLAVNKVGDTYTGDDKAFGAKYMRYKTTTFFETYNKQDAIIKESINYGYKLFLQSESQILSNLFKEKGFNSPIIAIDFLSYIQKKHPNLLPSFLTYEEFITEEVS